MNTKQETMTDSEIKEYQEEQLMALRYAVDMREVMKSKPHWSKAPRDVKMNALGLCIEQGAHSYGNWVWLKVVFPLNEDVQKRFVFIEERPVEFIER